MLLARISRLLPPFPIALLCLLMVLLVPHAPLYAQRQLPHLDQGYDSGFAQLDFAELYLTQEAWRAASHSSGKIRDLGPGDQGTVSALDLDAPRKAVVQFNRGIDFLKVQDSRNAIACLQKAIKIYPKFFSAHEGLGLAYSDQRDNDQAREEFESAAALDDSVPAPFANLGILALSANDFAGATARLEKAASLSGKNPRILALLTFAQNGNHKYRESLRTVERVHAINHRGFANVHYIAAADEIALHDREGAQRELSTFISEDPASPLAPVARQQLVALSANTNGVAPAREGAGRPPASTSSISLVQTFPNTEHLRAQLNTVVSENDDDGCDTCTPAAETPSFPVNQDNERSDYASSFVSWNNVFTIHQTVDETALFFAVSHHGHTVNDLALSNIQIRDNNQPPAKILQFIPQSKLPLRLGLLIDTSDSVSTRFLFEKRAAQKFITKVINSESDLAFVGGFNDKVAVTQDFTGDTASLAKGIEKIAKGGQTSIFDAVYYACWKLAAYPDQGRVARVLIVLTDGEDNSSHRSLQQALQEAEAAGVTIYTLSTTDTRMSETDADNILRVLADRSGGESIFPGSLSALDKYLSRLPDVIRSRYLVAYRPSGFAPDGKYRTIRVIAAKDGKRLKVHVRRGYYTRLAPNPISVARR